VAPYNFCCYPSIIVVSPSTRYLFGLSGPSVQNTLGIISIAGNAIRKELTKKETEKLAYFLRFGGEEATLL
jgi:hypothetical protein